VGGVPEHPELQGSMRRSLSGCGRSCVHEPAVFWLRHTGRQRLVCSLALVSRVWDKSAQRPQRRERPYILRNALIGLGVVSLGTAAVSGVLVSVCERVIVGSTPPAMRRAPTLSVCTPPSPPRARTSVFWPRRRRCNPHTSLSSSPSPGSPCLVALAW
jgi:hypothetical protein